MTFQDKDPALFGLGQLHLSRRRHRGLAELSRVATKAGSTSSRPRTCHGSARATGLIKHLVHHRMNTRECCVEAYMQFLKPGERSGKHRHMWEELIFVVEGSGYDLHWDMKFDCLDAFKWEWAQEPRKFEWKRGDYIYIPPFTTHQHFAGEEARLIMMSNRIVKEMGFDWFDQVENAPGF